MRLSTLSVAALLFAGAAYAQGQVEEYQPLPPPPLPSSETSPATPPPETASSPEQAPPLTSAPPPPPSSTPSSSAPVATATAPGYPAPGPKLRRTRITTGPLTTLALPLNGVSFEFERAMSDRFTLFAGPRFGVWPVLNASVSIGARYFPVATDTAPAGFWLGPESWTAFESTSGPGYGYVDFGEILLAMAGYTVIYPSGWTMSFGGGLGGGISVKSGTQLTTIVDPNGASRSAILPVSPFSPIPALALHWNVGYAF